MLFLELKSYLKTWIDVREEIVIKSIFNIYDYYKNAIILNAKSSNILTFDDLSYFTYRLLHDNIDRREFLYFKMDAKYKHILLDEFQDTSTLQFLLLKPLIDEIFSGHGQNEFKSFFYVGDTKQSLYRFRGGVEELFDRVADEYGINVKNMDTNYRSSKNVVEQVNRWFENSMHGYVPQKSTAWASEGYVKVLESEEVIEEAVLKIKDLLEQGIVIDDIAFLVNTNRDGQKLQEACHKEGINTLLKTSSSLKNIPKIAALVSMVSYLFYGDRIEAEALVSNVGKKLSDIDTSWFSAFMPSMQVVDRLIREFGYFCDDMNILKLLEFSSNYADIPTFIEEFKTSSIAVASNSVHGAKIMTIHGSKGLEFDYVILLDKLTKPNADRAALIFDYNDNLYIDKILYRTKGRENFDDSYERIMQKRKLSTQKDRKNVLYVALTRAVEGLIVIKKPEASIFDEIGISVMEIGKLKEIDMKSKSSSDENKKNKVVISNYGIQELSKKEDDSKKDHAAILFGTALHYALEMLSSFSKESLDSSLQAMHNKYGLELNSGQTQEIRRRIERLIGNEDFQKLLISASISKEQSLSFNGELKQIDLLLEYEDRCMVIDYKSSKKYAQKHKKEVLFYKNAIEKITKKPTLGIIVYLLENEVELYEM
jgi:exodeoxyribonuclease V beta subunit